MWRSREVKAAPFRAGTTVADYLPAECHDPEAWPVDAAVLIPMVAGMRSLNVAVAGAMVLGEALRQIEGFREISP